MSNNILAKVVCVTRLAVGSTKIPPTHLGYPTRPGMGSGADQSESPGSGLPMLDPIRTDPGTRLDHVIQTKPLRVIIQKPMFYVIIALFCQMRMGESEQTVNQVWSVTISQNPDPTHRSAYV